MRKFLAVIIFIFIIIIVQSCKPKQTYVLKKDFIDKPAYGDMLIQASIGEPANLNPVLASDSASFDIIGLVFGRLIRYDKNLKLEGELAKSWDISGDGKTLTFHLRRGIKWQDGVEFNSDDVKFTYDSFMDPSVKTAYRGYFEMVDKIETPDKYTVIVRYKKPYAPTLDTWQSTYIIPAHLLKGTDLNKSPFSRKPIGTGPYIFKKWTSNQSIELISNKNYFEGRPYITGIMYRIIPDQSVQFMNLQSGNLDMMSLSPDQYLKKTGSPEFNDSFNKYAYSAFQYTYIGFNMKNPLFASKKVRQALSYAINTGEIIEGVMLGLAKPVTGPFIPGTPAYNNKVKGYPYNPGKAAELLKSEGWVKGSDGILEKNGKKFKFILYTNQGNKQREQIAVIAQQQWSKLGISAEVRVLAWNIFITQFVDKKNFDAIVMGWSMSLDPDCYDLWHSSKTKEGEFNFVSYSNPEVDTLAEEGRIIFNPVKRAAIYNRIHALIVDDAPYIFLYSPLSLVTVHKRVQNIKPEASGIFYNQIQWYVPQEIQKYTVN